MIKWYSVESKVAGFAYYPLLEIGTGIFLMICSLAVPILFLVYNGVKLEQWGELLFCALFLLLFFFMGRSLIFQSMKVNLDGSKVKFYQNLREPATEFALEREEWKGFSTRDTDESGELHVVLYIKSNGEEKEFYRSVNRKEIKSMSEALIKLGQNDQGGN